MFDSSGLLFPSLHSFVWPLDIFPSHNSLLLLYFDIGFVAVLRHWYLFFYLHTFETGQAFGFQLALNICWFAILPRPAPTHHSYFPFPTHHTPPQFLWPSFLWWPGLPPPPSSQGGTVCLCSMPFIPHTLIPQDICRHLFWQTSYRRWVLLALVWWLPSVPSHPPHAGHSTTFRHSGWADSFFYPSICPISISCVLGSHPHTTCTPYPLSTVSQIPIPSLFVV